MNSVIKLLARTRLGVGEKALEKWKERGGVPHKYRLALLKLAKENKVALSESDFQWPTKKGAAHQCVVGDESDGPHCGQQ